MSDNRQPQPSFAGGSVIFEKIEHAKKMEKGGHLSENMIASLAVATPSFIIQSLTNLLFHEANTLENKAKELIEEANYIRTTVCSSNPFDPRCNVEPQSFPSIDKEMAENKVLKDPI